MPAVNQQQSDDKRLLDARFLFLERGTGASFHFSEKRSAPKPPEIVLIQSSGAEQTLKLA